MQNETHSNTQSSIYEADKPTYSDLVTPEDFVQERPDIFTKAKLQWLIRQRQQNGLSESNAVVKCGRTILIVRSKFYEWLLANKA